MKKQILKNIGIICKKARQKMGYTQSEMSAKLNEIFGTNSTYKIFSHFENGNSDSLIIFLCYLEWFGYKTLNELLNDIDLGGGDK